MPDTGRSPSEALSPEQSEVLEASQRLTQAGKQWAADTSRSLYYSILEAQRRPMPTPEEAIRAVIDRARELVLSFDEFGLDCVSEPMNHLTDALDRFGEAVDFEQPTFQAGELPMTPSIFERLEELLSEPRDPSHFTTQKVRTDPTLPESIVKLENLPPRFLGWDVAEDGQAVTATVFLDLQTGQVLQCLDFPGERK